MNNLIVLNLDDYHNIHTKRRADTTTTSDVHHFQTILLKETPAVPFTNLLMEKIFIILRHKFAFSGELPEAKNHEEHVEMLLVHNYDNRIQQHRDDRSMNNTKLVNLVEGNLHSTEDYIKALQNVFNVPELKLYLEKNILVSPMDYPGQFYVRRAISSCINSASTSELSTLLLHIVPMIGPLHVSLNSRETVFLLNYAFFNKLNCEVYLKKKKLAKRPKPYKINVLLELAASVWSLIRKEVLAKFCNCKNPEVRYLLDLLDPVIFQSGYRPAYKEAMFRVWMLFHRYGRKNYNKLPLAFFSDVFYWFTTHHPMASIIEQNFHLFNDYYVENFHSSLHLQTNKSNSSEAAIFLLELLMRMFNNHDNVVKIDASGKSGKNKKQKNKIQYKLPTLDTIVDAKLLPLAWSTSFHPRADRYCNREACELSHNIGCNLACGHSYHYECFLLNLSSQCQHCNEYLEKEEEEDDIMDEVDDDKSISLDTSVDTILDNLLSSFKDLGVVKAKLEFLSIMVIQVPI
ncbi:10112_t:CDS:2 [Entrophospora sp. SA101]|nr:10112_t:CDS:2 [Entrophospora sp. SA101]